jgi:tRNA pseudouridine55 synthase
MSIKPGNIITDAAKRFRQTKNIRGIRPSTPAARLTFPYIRKGTPWDYCVERGCLIPFTKPYGFTSRDLLNILQRELKASNDIPFKIGHGGTLDPMATGLMIVGINNATQALPDLLNCGKTYKFKIKLGEATESYDRESAITHKSDKWKEVTEQKLIEICNGFLGWSNQTVPLYSAVHYKGKRLYQYARKGIPVDDLPSKDVFIETISVSNFDGQTADIVAKCSKGTYVRTLAHDIGLRLNCYAHVIELERTEVGKYKLEEAWTLNEFLETVHRRNEKLANLEK